MNSIAQTNPSEKQLSEKMQYFLRRYHVSRILRSANAYKLRVFPVLSIFLVAFSTVFTQRSFFMQIHLQPGVMPFAKDTFYRFMNSCHIHWRRFTTSLAATIIQSTIAPLTSADRVNVLILDDSIYHRARSKKVELLARLYDHARKDFSYGFRMLTLCWSDGNTLLPVNHTLLSTENSKNRLRASSRNVDAAPMAQNNGNWHKGKHPRSCCGSCRKQRRRRFLRVTSCSIRGSALQPIFCPSMHLATRSLRWQRKRKRSITSMKA